jgi:flavin-dependent dehydrogenase
MRTGEWVSKISGASLRCGLEGTAGVVKGRVVGVGETIGTTFPFTGEGIGKAMHSGDLAARAISEAIQSGEVNALDDYQRRLSEEIKPLFKGYEVAQKWLSRPSLNDFMARRFVRSKYLQRCLREFMEETGDPRRLYSPLGIIKSYFV